MKKIDLTITARAPLAIGQKKPGGSVSEALDYIPGTVIRGAIAKEILRRSNSEPTSGDEFHQLFLDENAAIFRNGYCAIAQLSPDTYQLRTEPVQVVPASALSMKTDPGFRAVDTEKTGVFDSLIDSYCASAQGLFYVPNDIQGNLVDTFTGFYSQNSKGHVSHKVSKRLLTRVGINRKRATAQDEILYSIEVMNECQGKRDHPDKLPTVYRSSIVVSDALASKLCDFLKAHCTHLRLGGSASRGLGKVSLSVDDPYEIKGIAHEIEQRITDFNTTLRDRWGMWSTLGGISQSTLKERTFFTLTLHADAILTEHWRRTMVISREMLAPLIKVPAEDIQAHLAYSSYDYRSGWNAAWGLPKDTELITKMGGAMLFSIPKEQQDEVYKPLATLEQMGVGNRCSEGYGQLKVCDKFHQVMREEAV